MLECARCGRKIDERPYLIDIKPEMASNAVNDSKMTTTSNDTPAKPVQSPSLSHLRHNDSKMTTTSNDTPAKPVQSPSLSHLRHSDSKMTTKSNDTPAKPVQSPSLSQLRHSDVEMTTPVDSRAKPGQRSSLHHNDNKMTVTSDDIGSKTAKPSSSTPRHNDTAVSHVAALPSAMHKTAENNKDRIVNEYKDQNVDIERSVVKPPVMADRDDQTVKHVNVTDAKENHSPSLGNQQFKVTYSPISTCHSCIHPCTESAAAIPYSGLDKLLLFVPKMMLASLKLRLSYIDLYSAPS